MSLATVPQVNPNDEVTALSVNQGPNAIAAVVNGNIDDTNISTVSGSKITSGTLPVASFDTNSNPETREYETSGNAVITGLMWSLSSGLNGTMTAGTAYVNGKRLVVSSVASQAFTATRDTYVYLDSAGSIQTNPQTVGAAEPAIPANYITLAKVVTSGAAITSVVDLRPTPRTIRSARITSTFSTTSNTPVQVTGLTAQVNIPTGGRKLKITFYCRDAYRAGGGVFDIVLWDGTVGSGTQLQSAEPNAVGGSISALPINMVFISDTPFSAGAHTFNISLNTTTAASAQIDAGATYPALLIVELA